MDRLSLVQVWMYFHLNDVIFLTTFFFQLNSNSMKISFEVWISIIHQIYCVTLMQAKKI